MFISGTTILRALLASRATASSGKGQTVLRRTWPTPIPHSSARLTASYTARDVQPNETRPMSQWSTLWHSASTTSSVWSYIFATSASTILLCTDASWVNRTPCSSCVEAVAATLNPSPTEGIGATSLSPKNFVSPALGFLRLTISMLSCGGTAICSLTWLIVSSASRTTGVRYFSDKL